MQKLKIGLMALTLSLGLFGSPLEGFLGEYFDGNGCCNSNCGPRIYGSWLSWKVSGDEFDFAVVKHRRATPDEEVIDRESIHDIKFNWNDGFRLGIGYDNCCLGWDIDAIWTHFDAKSSRSLHVQGLDPIQPPFLDAVYVAIPVIDDGWVQLFSDEEGEFRASHHFRYDVVDIAFGKWFDIGCCSNVRFKPFVGIRIGDIQERFKDEFVRFGLGPSIEALPGDIAEIDFFHKNKFKGAGLLAGFAVDYKICGGLSLIGRGAGSLLWGRTHLRNHFGYSASLPDAYDSRIKEHYRDTRFITDLYFGFRYDTCFCSCFPVAIELAWEQHYIFREHRFLVDDSYFNQFTAATSSWRKNGSLSTQGLTLSAGVQF